LKAHQINETHPDVPRKWLWDHAETTFACMLDRRLSLPSSIKTTPSLGRARQWELDGGKQTNVGGEMETGGQGERMRKKKN